MSAIFAAPQSPEAAKLFSQAQAAGGEVRVDAIAVKRHRADREQVIRELTVAGLARVERRTLPRKRRHGAPLFAARAPSETVDVVVVEPAHRSAVVLVDPSLSRWAT